MKYKGDKRYFEGGGYDLYPRRCEIVGSTIVVYDMEFDRVCHVLEMKYLHETPEAIGQNVSVSSFNCDQICISTNTSRRGANFLVIEIGEAIKEAHTNAYGNEHDKQARQRLKGEGCCGNLDGGEMAEMSLASCEPGPGI